MPLPRLQDLERATPAQLRLMHAVMRRLVPSTGLADYIRRRWPNEPPPCHLMPLISEIERARRERVQTCVSMPPGHAKTVTLLRGVNWWLDDLPADTCGYLSYGSEQAESKSKQCRDMAIAGGLQLSESATSAAEWRTTKWGGMLASGVEGRLTGQRITGLGIIDDPYPNRKTADSAAWREEVWSWFVSVVKTRLQNASLIVLHTRWRDDDLIGRLSKTEGWKVINLPALAEDNDPLGRKPGEALWPEMYPVEVLEEQRRLDEYEFSALYQGQPRPRGARVFGEPHYYNPDDPLPNGARITMICDPAASEKTSADASVIGALATWGKGSEMRGRVLEVLRQQIPVPQLVRDIQTFRLRHGGGRVGIEAVGGFKAVPQMLWDIDQAMKKIIYEVTPVGDKFTRAQPAASAWNQGRIEVPYGAPWVPKFLEEVLAFTGVKDRADDQVDFLAHAWNQAMEVADPPRATLPNKPVLARRI